MRSYLWVIVSPSARTRPTSASNINGGALSFDFAPIEVVIKGY